MDGVVEGRVMLPGGGGHGIIIASAVQPVGAEGAPVTACGPRDCVGGAATAQRSLSRRAAEGAPPAGDRRSALVLNRRSPDRHQSLPLGLTARTAPVKLVSHAGLHGDGGAVVFVKRKVRRWMRHPKVSVEKAQGKGHIYPCSKCSLSEDPWYNPFPSPYGCCHHHHHQQQQQHQYPHHCHNHPLQGGPQDNSLYQADRPSPCLGHHQQYHRHQRHHHGHEQSKSCKINPAGVWKMLARHHGDVGGGKQKEAESEAMSMGGCQSWGVRPAPVLADPVMLECCVCSGPYISYALEDTWQPRQRTQHTQTQEQPPTGLVLN
ncbi:unnamed protein product [Gadus morhua 'NCC']